jgi:hypothetical protein
MCDERAGGVGDWRGLSHDARLDALVDLESRIASLQAQQLSLLAVIDGDPATVSLPGSGDKRWAVEDVACALRLSPGVPGPDWRRPSSRYGCPVLWLYSPRGASRPDICAR